MRIIQVLFIFNHSSYTVTLHNILWLLVLSFELSVCCLLCTVHRSKCLLRDCSVSTKTSHSSKSTCETSSFRSA